MSTFGLTCVILAVIWLVWISLMLRERKRKRRNSITVPAGTIVVTRDGRQYTLVHKVTFDGTTAYIGIARPNGHSDPFLNSKGALNS